MSTADAASTEVETLRAIYAEDLEALPPVWGCPAFRIRLQPVTGGTAEDNRVDATAKFVLPKRYPSEPYVWRQRCRMVLAAQMSRDALLYHRRRGQALLSEMQASHRRSAAPAPRTRHR